MGLIFLGDLHGDFNYLKKKIYTNGVTNYSMIQVGDFGIGFHTEKRCLEILNGLNEFLKKWSITLYVIRGNHDDPSYFNGDYVYSNLKLLPDYTVLNLEGKNILLVGGAISIDRIDRLKYERSWWPNEGFNYDSDKIIPLRGIDIVVTHNAPDFTWPTQINQLVRDYAATDVGLIDDLLKERKELTKMYETLSLENEITRYFYGHFHSSQTTQYRGTEFRLLGINEFYELR